MCASSCRRNMSCRAGSADWGCTSRLLTQGNPKSRQVCGIIVIMAAGGIVVIDILVTRPLLFEERQHQHHPGAIAPDAGRGDPLGQTLVGVMVIVRGQGELLEVVLALQPGGGLADL